MSRHDIRRNLLRQRIHGAHGLSINAERERRGVHDAKTVHAHDARLGVHHGHRVVLLAHRARAHAGVVGVGSLGDVAQDLVVGLVLDAGENLGPGDDLLHGLRGDDLTAPTERGYGHFLVARVVQPPWVHHRVLGGIGAVDRYRAAAERGHKGRRHAEVVLAVKLRHEGIVEGDVREGRPIRWEFTVDVCGRGFAQHAGLMFLKGEVVLARIREQSSAEVVILVDGSRKGFFATQQLAMTLDRDWAGGAQDDGVLQILAEAGPIREDRNIKRLQRFLWTDARHHEQLWGPHHTRTDDDLLLRRNPPLEAIRVDKNTGSLLMVIE